MPHDEEALPLTPTMRAALAVGPLDIWRSAWRLIAIVVVATPPRPPRGGRAAR